MGCSCGAQGVPVAAQGWVFQGQRRGGHSSRTGQRLVLEYCEAPSPHCGAPPRWGGVCVNGLGSQEMDRMRALCWFKKSGTEPEYGGRLALLGGPNKKIFCSYPLNFKCQGTPFFFLVLHGRGRGLEPECLLLSGTPLERFSLTLLVTTDFASLPVWSKCCQQDRK